MKITSNIEFDENGNQITYLYCDNRVISKQVKKAVPDSEVNMPLKKRAYYKCRKIRILSS